jgi:hypothetical protein
MYQKLRAIHLSTALFSLIFLLAYGISSVEFAHRKWFAHPTRTTEEHRKFEPNITDARVLARQWHGELTSVETPSGLLKFQVTTALGTSYRVEYSIATGDANIKTTTVSFLTSLAFIHVSHGIWTAVVALLSIALLTLGLTGLYLWFKNQAERRIGFFLLTLGAGVALVLIVTMRME